MTIAEIFKNARTIAVVGFSDNRSRASNRISRFLVSNGYEVYGVNPDLSGKSIDGIRIYGSVKNIPVKIDIINIFRRSEFLYDLIKEILLLKEKPAVIWTQIGVIDSRAGDLSLKHGIFYIENKCIMTEYQNLNLQT